jgi:glycosyltransferase involved in cell wall biosynthesis
MIDQPLVSILMTSYNREEYIAEAIESVLASTYKNFELIIVDDCSVDKTVSIAKSFSLKDKRIRLYVNEKNLGDYPNRNQATSYASGEFLMFVDSDDKLLESGIENCIKTMKLFPQSSFGIFYLHSRESPFLLDSNRAISKHFFEKSFLTIGPGGTIIKRTYFEKINRYPTKYGPANDMYFNLKAVCSSPVVLLPFVFFFYRMHDGQELNNKYSYLVNSYQYLNDALLELTLPLTDKQKKWLVKKNKRRFVVNISKFFFKTFNLKKTKNVILKTHFSIKDAIEGIFHFD